MPMDPGILDAINTVGIQAHQASMTRIGIIGENLTQGLGVVNTTLIQQHGGVADDPAQFGAMNTAAGIPQSGYQKGA